VHRPIDPAQVPAAIRQIIGRLDQEGFETWLVGGCVRDLCLNRVPKDFDLATDALPEQVMGLFDKTFATGLQHGTVTVLWQDLAVEITTFRSESAYSDARRPDRVIFHDQIDKDLARRDFTMNSMAWRPDRGLLDLHGGLADLRQGVLRCVGDPLARFDEDALRLLRAVRFAVTYDLQPEPELRRAAGQLAGRLIRLSRERLLAEVMRILMAPCPGRLLDFSGCGMLAQAAEILLEVSCDDRLLCSRLARMIDPGLAREQCLPLLLVAASSPVLTPRGVILGLQPYLTARAGNLLQHLFMIKSRLSRHMAQAGEAMLYLFWLRVQLPIDHPPDKVAERRLLRLLARRCHLASGQIWPVVAATAQLLDRCLAGQEPAHQAAGITSAGYFLPPPAAAEPLTLADLQLNGRALLALGIAAGPDMRLLLERLLSRVVVDAAANQADRLAELALAEAGLSR
jgi:hypothetical protein